MKLRYKWMDSLSLVTNPGTERLIFAPLQTLLLHKSLSTLESDTRNMLVWSPGTVFFRFVAIQHELDETPNLDGSLLNELRDKDVVCSRLPSSDAMDKMWTSIDPILLQYTCRWDLSKAR